MCDETLNELLGTEDVYPGIRYAAFNTVGAAVSRVERRAGWDVVGTRRSGLIPHRSLPKFATTDSYKQMANHSQMQQVLAEIASATNGAKELPLPAFQAIFDGKDEQGKTLACGAEVARRLFNAITHDGVSVSVKALARVLLVLHIGSLAQRTALLWALMCDKAGRLRHADLKELLQACGADARLRVGEDAASRMASAFFRKAGKTDNQELTYKEFASVLQGQPEMLQSLHIAGIRVAAQADSRRSHRDVRLPFFERQQDRLLRHLGMEDLRFAAWMAFFVLCQLAGFVAVLVQYLCIDSRQPAYALAKAAAQSIQIVMAVLLFTVCRNLLTCLRATPLQWLMPFDDHLKTHAWLGAQLLFWSTIHSVAHLVRNQINPRVQRGGVSVPSTPAEVYKQATPITGLILAAILLAGYFFASLRRGDTKGQSRVTKALRSFHIFQISHAIMTVSVLVLLILHPLPGTAARSAVLRAPTWIYLLPSLAVYGAERLWRFFGVTSDLVQVEMIRLLPDNVVELRLQRPALWFFRQQAGQYAYVMVPQISCWDWHPFTISSAPSDRALTFHIKALGGWTRALQKLAQQCIAQQRAAADVEAGGPGTTSELPRCLRPDIKVALDGPFGAPSQDQKLYDIVVLVGGGVAVTPFLSILRQLVNDFEKSRCTRCEKPNRRLCPVRHVYFHWTVREQASPRYLEQVLKAMMSRDYKDFISINIHLTSALKDNDLRACIARVAQRLLHAEDGYDAVARATLPVPLSFGRPSWTQVLSRVVERHDGCKIGVFVCGMPRMTSMIKSVCNQLNRREAERQSGTQLLFRAAPVHAACQEQLK